MFTECERGNILAHCQHVFRFREKLDNKHHYFMLSERFKEWMLKTHASLSLTSDEYQEHLNELGALITYFDKTNTELILKPELEPHRQRAMFFSMHACIYHYFRLITEKNLNFLEDTIFDLMQDKYFKKDVNNEYPLNTYWLIMGKFLRRYGPDAESRNRRIKEEFDHHTDRFIDGFHRYFSFIVAVDKLIHRLPEYIHNEMVQVLLAMNWYYTEQRTEQGIEFYQCIYKATCGQRGDVTLPFDTFRLKFIPSKQQRKKQEEDESKPVFLGDYVMKDIEPKKSKKEVTIRIKKKRQVLIPKE